MLVLSGFPTLFPKLVESRTFAERMFRVLFLDRLDERQCRDAILKPLEDADCPVTIERLAGRGNRPRVRRLSVFPSIHRPRNRRHSPADRQGGKEDVSTWRWTSVIHKLDTDFFAGRWARTTDRQQELLSVIAELPNCEDEFSVQQIVERSQESPGKPFRGSRVSQMLSSLCDAGLVYRNRHGKYSFAIPLLGRFILHRQSQAERNAP